MALLYPWATREYLLWEMSLSQIIYYHNVGLEMKYGKRGEEIPEGGKPGLSYRTKDVRKQIEEAKRLYGDIE